jgi:hypothetical protein
MTRVYLLFLISLCQKNDRLGAFLTMIIGWTASIVSSLLRRSGVKRRGIKTHPDIVMPACRHPVLRILPGRRTWHTTEYCRKADR